MAIQPIDLQTMYSQLSNISQNVGAQHNAAHMSQITTLETQKNENLDNQNKVQSFNDDKANSKNVDENGSNGNNYPSQQQYKQQKEAGKDIQPDNKISTNDNSTLGRIIDISR